MVRVKPLPERALVEGRVTMRETTREIIHEVSVGEQYSHQQHESNSYYVGPNEYMTDEQDYARLPGNQSKQYVHQQHNSNSYNYAGPSEYTTNEQDYSRLLGNRRKRGGASWSHRLPFQRQQLNQYIDEQYSSSGLERPRDSTQQSSGLPHSTIPREGDDLHSQIQNENIFGNRVKSRIDRRISGEDRFTEGLIGQNSGSNGPNLGNRESSVYDVNTLQGSSSIRSGGVPRYGRCSSALIGNRKQRYRPGARALQEIRRYQKTTKLLIPKRPFQRIVQEVVRDLYPKEEYRFSAGALEALQEISEAFIVEVFDSTCTCAAHANRVTVMPNDLHLLRMLQRW